MPPYLSATTARADGHIGTAFDGRLSLVRDPINFQIEVFSRETGQRAGVIDEVVWEQMDDGTRARWLADLLADVRKGRVHENTQGVLDFLAEIGRRWAAA